MYIRNDEIIIDEIIIEEINERQDQIIIPNPKLKIRFDILNDFVQTKIIELVNNWFVERNSDIKLIKFLGLYLEHKYYIQSLNNLNRFIST